MKLHRFFIENLITQDTIVVKDQNLLNQWKNVLRFNPKSTLILLDNSGSEFICTLTRIDKKEAVLQIMERKTKPTASFSSFHLFPALIKRERFELMLEKTTELGVEKYFPVLAERSVKTSLNRERSEKIIKESAEQSGKKILPLITNSDTLAHLAKTKEEGRVYFALDPQGSLLPLTELRNKKIGAFIGPEGGFSEKEISIFRENNIPVYSLGEQILRAETAAIALASLILLQGK